MKKNGFTLVELIVVIAIIGVLVSLGYTNYQTSLARARDGKRKGDLEQIRSALEMYRTDKGYYPKCSNWSYLSVPGYDCGSGIGQPVPWGHNAGLGCSCLPQNLAGYSGGTQYMKSLPIDPSQYDCACSQNRAYFYEGISDGMSYTLYTKLENSSDSSINCSGCGPAGFANYKVTNP